MKKILGLVFINCMAISGCGSSKQAIATDRNQGLQGTVYGVMGNQMPMKGAIQSGGKGVAVTVLIFAITNQSQTSESSNTGYYSTVNTQELARVKTNKEGYFKIALPIGKYSLFIKTDKGFYANLRDQFNNLAAFEVVAGEYTNVKLTLQNGAVD
jgi:hypothetical protein